MPAPKSGDPGFSILPLLVRTDSALQIAKNALLVARASPPAAHLGALNSAACVLQHQTGPECGDALEIVALDDKRVCD